MRILTQLVNEFGNEYPLYECTTGTSTQNLFNKPQQPNNNPNNIFGQQQNYAQNSNTNIAIGNIPTQTNYNVGGQNQKDQLLAPLKKRCRE